MLACVCQPTETALLFKGGPPVAMGPLSASRIRHNNTCTMKAIKIIHKQDRRLSEETKLSSPSLTSSPCIINTAGSLLNLRKIEKRAKSTKILVNPVFSDNHSASDDTNRSKNEYSKWNVKKKRFKSDIGKYHKKEERKSDRNDLISREGAREDKKSISCFKLKSYEDKFRFDEDRKLGKDNCTNENASNSISVLEPDIINHCKKGSTEILVDESTMTDQIIKTDQLDTGKTDSAIVIRKFEVSIILIKFISYLDACPSSSTKKSSADQDQYSYRTNFRSYISHFSL